MDNLDKNISKCIYQFCDDYEELYNKHYVRKICKETISNVMNLHIIDLECFELIRTNIHQINDIYTTIENSYIGDRALLLIFYISHLDNCYNRFDINKKCEGLISEIYTFLIKLSNYCKYTKKKNKKKYLELHINFMGSIIKM